MSGLPYLYSDLTRWGVVQTDTLQLLPKLPAGSVDAVVSDPPYGIDMGGMAWDGKQMRNLAGGRISGLTHPEAFEHFTYLWAVEALRILKPGGHLICFGAPRTFHRVTSAIEDVGFEVRDVLLWMFSSGMPKSRRYPDGLGSALKPAYEPILLARKPVQGTLQENHDEHGTGLLSVETATVMESTAKGLVWRWPANVAFTHTDRCNPVRCSPVCPARVMDTNLADLAPLSRIFYSTKAGRGEREAGLEDLPATRMSIMKSNGRVKPRANTHQTVKPVDLMRWLVRLVTPPGGLVLDPFAGSGSTGIAATLEGRQFLGVEREPDYVRISHHRIRHWLELGSGANR